MSSYTRRRDEEMQRWGRDNSKSKNSKSPKTHNSYGIKPSNFYRKHDDICPQESDEEKSGIRSSFSSRKSSTTFKQTSTSPQTPLCLLSPRRRNRLQLETNLNRILKSAYHRYSSNRCQEWYNQNIKIRRAAFRDVSFLKTYPIQEWAVKEFQRQMDLHLNQTCKESDNERKENRENHRIHSNVNQEIAQSLSGTSSSSVEVENKRRKDQSTSDTSSSTERARFKVEFLKEREFSRCDNHLNRNKLYQRTTQTKEGEQNKESPENEFLPPLWSMEPRIFAIEMSKTGKRKYVVGSFGRIADLYWRKVSPLNRHYYELIKEDTPCRLYFDLEFCKIANNNISQSTCEMILDDLYLELSQQFKSMYPSHCPPLTRSCILDLDSSTDVKFSRHWIIHLSNGALFSKAGDAGSFVKLWVGKLAEEIATGILNKRRPILAKYLFVKPKGTKKEVEIKEDIFSNRQTDEISKSELSKSKPTTCIIDLGVYTRNRLFRLMGAAKYGKPPSAALRIADTNAFVFPKSFTNDKFYFPLLGKIQENDGKEDEEDFHTDMANLKIDLEKFQKSMDWSLHAEALAQTLIVPLNATKINFPILPGPSEIDEGNIVPLKKHSTTCTKIGDKINSRQQTTMGPSPFQGLDKYVSNVLAQRKGINGMIRAWSMDLSFPKNTDGITKPFATITYQMSRNRYCENVGRAHKGNNIMWIVDLVALQCWQSCHDPECRASGFRGAYIDLPDDVKCSVKEALFEMEMAQLDEDQLIKETKANKIAAKIKKVRPKTDIENPWEFGDDEEFEKALLNLDISGKSATCKDNSSSK